MKIARVFSLITLIAQAVSLAGCCCGGDTTTETRIIEKQPIQTNPLGDELIKLKDASDKGAMTEQEYEDAKAKLLKGQ